MARGPAIVLDIGEKRYRELAQPIFTDLRFSIEPGSTVALVGRSGVGKSTLLRMLAGIDRDFRGTLTVGGQLAWEAPPPGIVFQDSRLLPWLSAVGNITAVRPETTREMALGWLDRVGLAGYGDALPDQLSGGMQRRVALARALSVNPAFLLLDEPFVSLDRQLANEIEALFRDLVAAELSTVVLVTHLAEDAARLADRVLILDGRPAQIAADHVLPSAPRERDLIEVARIATLLSVKAKELAA